MSAAPVKTIGVTAFKAKCLGLVEEVISGETAHVVVTKRGRPVAELRPLAGSAQEKKSALALHGALKHMMKVDPEFDLTTPTSELIGWNPENVKLYNE